MDVHGVLRHGLICGLVAIVGAASAAGCGAQGESTGGRSAAGELAGPVTLVRGGGIAGGTLEVSVEPSGSVTLSGDGGAERRAQLSGAELERLARAVNSTPFAEIGERTTEACADCFVYTVAYDGSSLTVDQAADGDPADQADAVIGELVAVAEEAGSAE